MGSRIYHSSETADVSGYQIALVDMRNPAADGTASTFVTNTTASGDDIEMTPTAGGTATNWITKPFRSDVTINGTVYKNFWGLESAAGANATIGTRLAEYTTSEQANFSDDDDTVELTTASALRTRISAAPTSTLIDTGNRLVIDMRVVPVGTMGGSETVTFNYETDDDDESGDSFILLQELVRCNEVQRGGGATVLVRGKGVGTYEEVIQRLNEFLGVNVAANETVRALIDDLEFERDNQ